DAPTRSAAVAGLAPGVAGRAGDDAVIAEGQIARHLDRGVPGAAGVGDGVAYFERAARAVEVDLDGQTARPVVSGGDGAADVDALAAEGVAGGDAHGDRGRHAGVADPGAGGARRRLAIEGVEVHDAALAIAPCRSAGAASAARASIATMVSAGAAFRASGGRTATGVAGEVLRVVSRGVLERLRRRRRRVVALGERVRPGERIAALRLIRDLAVGARDLLVDERAAEVDAPPADARHEDLDEDVQLVLDVARGNAERQRRDHE